MDTLYVLDARLIHAGVRRSARPRPKAREHLLANAFSDTVLLPYRLLDLLLETTVEGGQILTRLPGVQIQRPREGLAKRGLELVRIHQRRLS